PPRSKTQALSRIPIITPAASPRSWSTVSRCSRMANTPAPRPAKGCAIRSSLPAKLHAGAPSILLPAMSWRSFWKTGWGLRLATLLLPPVGLLLLWIGPRKLLKKLLGTLGILLFSLLYAAGVIWLLIRFAGLEVEWRGGYVPALTFHKTVPDYAAL